MKKMNFIIICTIFFIFFITNNAISVSKTNIAVGVNYSTLRNEGGKSEPGAYLGISRDIYPFRSFHPYFGFGLSFTTRKVILENKTWPTGLEPEKSDIMLGNLPVDKTYLNIPVKIGYHLFKNKKFSINVYSSLALCIPISNNARFTNYKIIELSNDEKGKHEFDYVRGEEISQNISSNAQIGLILFYKKIGIGYKIERALKRTKPVNDMVIRDELDSFQILFHLYF